MRDMFGSRLGWGISAAIVMFASFLAQLLYQSARVALLLGTRDPAAAVKFYNAIFSLGLKLYQERVVFDELSAGEDLMGTAAVGLQHLAERGKDSARARAIQQFNTDRLNDYQAKVQ